MPEHQDMLSGSCEKSFIEIFGDGCAAIYVPSIQRDYAQGRESEKAKKVRHDFIGELHGYLLEDDSSKSHSLDFIYGFDSPEGFVPLDGQQRLTTLWLLHIYLGALAGRDLSAYTMRYATRDTSTRFCARLHGHAGEIFTEQRLSEMVNDKATKKMRPIRPSEIIKNEPWWYSAWEDDPTVKGMLCMLDEIHGRMYANRERCAKRLFDERPVIFEFLPLKGFHDIDDLYIKMNSRGLPLTPFEVFKSKLIDDIVAKLPEAEKKFKADIDVKWADLLWRHRAPGAKNIDNFLENTLKLLIPNEGVALSNKLDEDTLNLLFEANGKKLTFGYKWFTEHGIDFNKELLSRLIADMGVLFDDATSTLGHADPLNGYDSHWFDVARAISLWVKEYDNVIKPDYHTRLMLHAYLRFNSEFPSLGNAELTEWMRLMHNLAEATNFNSSKDLAELLKDVNSIIADFKKAKDADPQVDVNGCIADTFFTPEEFPAYQWAEEVAKARLRKDLVWRQLIDRAERNPYLNGQIGITLYVAGIYPSRIESIPDPTPYRDALDKLLPLFDAINDESSRVLRDYLLVKAMMGVGGGDWMPWYSACRKNLYNKRYHRDYSWKALFLFDKENKAEAHATLRKLVYDPDYNPQTVEKSLENLGARTAGKPEWMQILMGPHGASIMSRSKQGFIAFFGENEANTLIYHQSQRNHYHDELRTINLYFDLLARGLKPKYYPVRSSEDPILSISRKNITYNKRSPSDPTPWRINNHPSPDPGI